MSDEIKTQLTNAVPDNLREEMAYLVDKTRHFDDSSKTTEQLLEDLQKDGIINHLLTAISQKAHSDTFDAQGSQGFVNNPSGPVNQYFGLTAEEVIQIIRSPAPAASAPAPQTQPRNEVIDLYRQRFARALRQIAAPPYNFPLKFRLISADGTSSDDDTPLPIDQLLEQVRISSCVILRGAAGSGKSTGMKHLAELFTHNDQANIVPIYLQLRGLDPKVLQALNDATTADTEPEHYIQPLLSTSIVLLGVDYLKQLGEQASEMNNGMLLIMADGLNEIYGEETAGFILKRLAAYVANLPVACALISDRITPRDGITNWQQARMERLTADVVREQFAAKNIDALYTDLSESDQTLLQTPYFLAYALAHNTSRLSSAAEAIAAFFEEFQFDEDTIDRIAKAAFNAYEDHHSYRFDVAPFMHTVGRDIFDQLIYEGVINTIPTEANTRPNNQIQSIHEQAQFDHPLKHDYLAARYLSKHEEAWIPRTLDIVSFDSNSYDALAMTLELLPKADQADRFIERVHNWNWAAALVCIAKAMRTGSGRHSLEIQMAVLALVTERLFDPVQQTRQRASEVLSLFPEAIAAPYKQVRSVDELYTLVQQQVRAETQRTGREAWFSKWGDLFVRPNDVPLTEQDLKQIIHPQGIIGWTAAIVLRRLKLAPPDIRQLRAYYDACMICDPDDWQASTVRSRVLLAVGATDTEPVVDLLLEALNQDTYAWSRIGAARSLVEVAALTSNDKLRHSVIDTLIDLTKQTDSRMLALKTLREIGQSAFYRNAPGAWEQAMTPLIELMRDMQQQTPEQEWWSGLLIQFKDFCKEQAGSAERAVER